MDNLPEDARFRAYLAIGDDWNIKGLEKARKMGKSYLPILEEVLLSIGSIGTRSYWVHQLFLDALTLYEFLGGVPTSELQRKLFDLKGWPQKPGSGGKQRSDIIKVANRILIKSPKLPPAELVSLIRGSSGDAQLEAIHDCRNATERHEEIVEALIPIARKWGKTR